MKKIILLFCLLFTQFHLWSQSPNWSVNQNDYEYNMTFVAFLNVDSQDLNSESDKVAAFVDGVCRGVCNLKYNASRDAYYAYLKVFSNTNNESFEFKIYDSQDDKVISVSSQCNFHVDESLGDLTQPYSIAEPSLSKECEIKTFTFSNIQILDLHMGDDFMQVDIKLGLDVTELKPEFTLSEGAILYRNSEEQISGYDVLDFTEPVEYFILSEDKSNKQLFKVSVNFVDVEEGVADFYKKDAVCYSNGAIKVNFSIDNTTVNLSKDGIVVDSGVISANEIIFSDLEPGEYKVIVGDVEKMISIYQN